MKLIQNSQITLPNKLWAWKLADENLDHLSDENSLYLFIPESSEITIKDIIQAELTSNVLKFEYHNEIYYTMIDNLCELLDKNIDNNF